MLELLPRIPFGPANDALSQSPWPGPVAPTFDVAWLTKTFIPDQESRLRQVTEAIADATKRIETIRKQAISVPIEIGQKLPNGNIVRSGAEQRLQHEIESHAKQQVVRQVIEIRNSLDKIVPPVIVTMHRAAHSARTLSARYFDKISCLARYSAGLGKAELASLKANYVALIRGMAPIELARLAQNAIDNATDPYSFVLLDVIRTENFGRKRDDRAFENSKLVGLIPVQEYEAAQPLLQSVVDLYNEANTEWADFSGKTMRATNLRMGHGLGKLALKEETVTQHA